jgi:hypothetical protein
MALGSTQPLTEMSTRNLPGGKWRPVRKADIPTARAVQRGARGRHGARDILSWRPTLLCRL